MVLEGLHPNLAAATNIVAQIDPDASQEYSFKEQFIN